jgi:hypothetical protein
MVFSYMDVGSGFLPNMAKATDNFLRNGCRVFASNAPVPCKATGRDTSPVSTMQLFSQSAIEDSDGLRDPWKAMTARMELMHPAKLAAPGNFCPESDASLKPL